MIRFAAIAAALSLVACGGGEPADRAAGRLEEAASQSDPAAAEILENAADQIAEQDAMSAGAANAASDAAMRDAGNAQAAIVPPSPAPAPAGAKAGSPRASGTMPPPKTDPGG